MAAAAATVAAATGTAAQHPSVITNPDWLRRPTADEIGSVWPAQAMRQRLGGIARLKCEVDLQGLVQDCSVLSEDPPGMGFGGAALALAPKFLFRPGTRDGAPVTSWVTIPINFSMEGGSPKDQPRPPIGSHIPGGQPVGEEFFLVATVPWDRAPSSAELAAAYPRDAKPGTGAGHVVLACRFSKSGDLKDCTTDVERPQWQGFGQAAKSLTPKFHLDPAAAAGIDLSKLRINLAIHFTPPGSQESRLIDHPEWISAGESNADLFPAKAARAGLATGRAVLDCVADSAGRMAACQVTSEDPAGMDFGAAAVKTTAAVRINRWQANGEPADGAHVIFAVRLNKDDAAPAAKPPAAP